MSRTFVLTEQSYADALALDARKRISRPGILVGMATTFAVIVVLISGQPWSETVRSGNAVWLVVGALFFAVLMKCAFPRASAWLRAGREFRSHPILSRVRSLDVRADGICLHDDTGNQTVMWSDMVDLADNDQVMLVYLSPRLFVPLPKGAVSPDEVHAIQAGFLSRSAK